MKTIRQVLWLGASIPFCFCGFVFQFVADMFKRGRTMYDVFSEE